MFDRNTGIFSKHKIVKRSKTILKNEPYSSDENIGVNDDAIDLKDEPYSSDKDTLTEMSNDDAYDSNETDENQIKDQKFKNENENENLELGVTYN